MDTSPAAMAPLLVRNLLTSIFIFTDKSLLLIVDKFKILQILRYLLISAFLFLLQILPAFFPIFNLSEDNQNLDYLLNPRKVDNRVPASDGGGSGDSCIARALSQLLSVLNEIPVSSRKYEVVKSLAEKLIVDNIREDCEALSEVNRTALSAAFARTLTQLEVAAMEQEGDIDGGSSGLVARPVSYYGLNRVLRRVRSYGDAAWSRFGKPTGGFNRFRSSAEKLAAELLWLGEKLVDCGGGEEAVCRWASASNLAWLALSAGPRLQGSLVKISAFMLKQVKELGGEESKRGERRQTKMKMLVSWLPFLCRASGGVDAPVLTLHEKSELEKDLEEIIQSLRQEEEQERVLTLWLHHFTHCPSSDWPNLHSSYERWCTASRKLLIFTKNAGTVKTISS